MEFQEFVPSVPYVASVLVGGVFLWRVFVRMLEGMDDRFASLESRFDDRLASLESRFDDWFGQIDSRFGQIDDRFSTLEKMVDGLANDHHGLSRELSEFRGEMRGRLSMLIGQDAAGEA